MRRVDPIMAARLAAILILAISSAACDEIRPTAGAPTLEANTNPFEEDFRGCGPAGAHEGAFYEPCISLWF